MNVGDALGFGKLLFDLGARIYEAVAHRDFDRVERILPATLRTTLAKQLADDDATQHFEAARERMTADAERERRRDEPTVPVMLPRIPDSGEAG